MKRVIVYFFAFSLLLIFTDAIFAQCGADGTQPCGTTGKSAPKKTPSKLKSSAPPKSKSVFESPSKTKSAAGIKATTTNKKAEAFYKQAWDNCPSYKGDECKRSYWTKAIEIDPNYVDALDMRAFSYKSTGNLDESVKDYTRLIELQPKTSKYYFFRASIAKERAEKSNGSAEKKVFYDEAVKDFSKAIELDSADSDSLRYRGNIYLEREEFERAIADFTVSIKLATKSNSFFDRHYYDRGRAFTKRADKQRMQGSDTSDARRDYEDAVKDFSKAIEAASYNGHYYAMRGYVLYQQNNFDAAVKDLTAAIKASKWDQDKFSYYWRGMAYEKLGKTDLAAADKAKYNALK